MTALTFDVEQFRANYPVFASSSVYPDNTLQGYWDGATCFVSADNYGYLADDCRQQAINLMTAHIAQLSTQTNTGNSSHLVTSSAIDKVSVSITPPPFGTSTFKHWLCLTPYGAQLMALLRVKSVGGLYVGGSNERSAFRKGGGWF